MSPAPSTGRFQQRNRVRCATSCRRRRQKSVSSWALAICERPTTSLIVDLRTPLPVQPLPARPQPEQPQLGRALQPPPARGRLQLRQLRQLQQLRQLRQLQLQLPAPRRLRRRWPAPRRQLHPQGRPSPTFLFQKVHVSASGGSRTGARSSSQRNSFPREVLPGHRCPPRSRRGHLRNTERETTKEHR